MKNKKMLLKLKALFFTGIISAATLRGCTYGPPPAIVDIDKSQQALFQNSDINKVQEYINSLGVKNEETEKI